MHGTAAWQRQNAAASAFTLVEILLALAILTLGFVGALATISQSIRMVADAEEEMRVVAGLDQRIDEIRSLSWTQLTGGTGVVSRLNTRSAPLVNFNVTRETLTVTAYNQTGVRGIRVIRVGTSAPTLTLLPGATSLNNATAIRIEAEIVWTGGRAARSQTRSFVTVLARRAGA
jgi:type II secretory pathway pseudopilin PulG